MFVRATFFKVGGPGKGGGEDVRVNQEVGEVERKGPVKGNGLLVHGNPVR